MGPEPFGIVVCRFVGTVPDILRLVWLRFRPNPARNRRFPAGSEQVFGALLAQPRQSAWCMALESCGALDRRWAAFSHPEFSPRNPEVCSSPSAGTLRKTQNIKMVQTLCPERVRGPIFCNQTEKHCGAFGPTHFSHYYCTILASGPSPDTIAAQF